MTQELSPSPEAREVLVKAAILAPSMHNAQPWLFRFRGRDVEVHKDPRYELAAEDPDGRLTMIGVGAATFNVRVAMAMLGWTPTTVLMPDPDKPSLAATLTLSPAADAGTDLAELFDWLARRRTNRYPFSDRPIPAQVREALQQAAAEEHATLEWVEDAGRIHWLHELAADADNADAHEPQRLAERQSWVGGQRDREGIPSTSLGPRPADPSRAVRDLAADRADRIRAAGQFEDRPTLAVLLTRHDSAQDWLVAGQALQRVLLVATRHGVAASLLNQPIEHKDLRWLVRDPLTGLSEPQAVLRFGYGPEVPPTPRRPLEEFILDDDPLPGQDVTDADG